MKKRSSNFELLRIIAMLMIVFFHIMIHWPKEQILNEGLQNIFNNGWFNNPVFYKKLLIIYTAMPMGTVGNGLFMMISGYFLSYREEIDVVKVSRKILTQLGYATILLVLSSSLIYYIVNQKTERFFLLLQVTDFNSGWWFIGFYYAVVVVAAFILNKYMIRADQKKSLSLVLIVFSFVEIGFSGGLLDGIGSGLRTLGIGIFFYLLGGYIHKYDPFRKVRGYVFFVVVILANILNYVSYYNDTNNRIQYYMQAGGQGTFMQPIYQPVNHYILIVLIAVSIFEIFKRINMPNSNIINYLGASTFMVYLIHENGFFQSLYDQSDCITLLYNHPILFMIEIVKWLAIAFASGIIAYTIFTIGAKICNRLKWIVINTKDN